MSLFSTIFKIIKKIKGMLILYTVILISMTSLNLTSGNTTVMDFQESKSDILIINYDKEEGITKGLIDYLKEHSNIKDIDVNNKEEIDDALFYREVNYILYIPKNFNEDILNNKIPNVEYKATGDYYSSLSKMLVEKYISNALLYKDYFSNQELIDKINNVVNNDIEIELKTKLDTAKLSAATRYFNFLNYSFLAGCVYCIGYVLASIKNKNVFKRTIISSYDFKKYNKIVLLANFIVILFMWLLYMILSFILFKDLMLSTNGLLFILNSFIFIICSLSIGFLIGNITQNKNALGGIINVVALGTSFLCGCFVPLEYLPESVINIAKCLPTYYYTNSNEYIKTLETFNFDSLKPILINSVILIGFTILFVMITNYLSKKNRKIG